MPDHVRGANLHWSSFVVDETPYCMWGADLQEQNQRLIDGVDPRFFNYLADTHVAGLEGPERQHAALAMRLAYAQAVETLFALLCAALQAPNCPLGWLLAYKNRELKRVVQHISSGSPVLSRSVTRPVTWHSISRDLHAFTHASAHEDARIKNLFADTWARLAREFTDDLAADEYNSIKHGFRAQTGGSSLQIRNSGVESDTSLNDRSEFGTRFFSVDRLSSRGTNFSAQNAMRNWAPVSLAVRMELIVLSIGNVVTYLRMRLGSIRDNARYQWPEDTEALRLAWEAEFVIESGQGGVILKPEDISPKLESEILASYHTG